MDVVVRTAIYTLCDTPQCRKDTLFIAHLEGPPHSPLQIYMDSETISRPVSERKVGGIVKRLIASGPTSDMEFRELVSVLAGRCTLFTLHEYGRGLEVLRNTLRGVGVPAFIIGDQQGFPKEIERYLLLHTKAVSIGSRAYLASHVAAFINEVLDRVS